VLDTAVNSIFKIDARDVDDVYSGRRNVDPGLQVMAGEFNPQGDQADTELTRYILSLFVIEKKLTKRGELVDMVRRSIDKATTQLEHYGTDHPNTWAALADIYQHSVSSLTPRIMVNGEQLHLANETNAAKIRTLLLAALRSVVLWRQCGGSRLGFVFNRRNYFREANSLLASAS
jgi:high frequency lysogenization protein